MNAYELYVKVGADLEGLQSGLTKAKGMATNVMNGIGNVAKVGLGATTAVIAGATTAVTAFGKQALGSYAEYEQLIGGVETLYEDLSVDIVDYAKDAYKTAGKSANEYYQTAISFAGALNKSLEESDGNIARSARVTDMIITDMSDNVNKMGTDMEMVENAYRGFSRGNFTMLDNLSLGFAGTKEGMQELLDKAQEISGIEYDISSFADIADAIHVVQEKMGIAGTTAREAMTTIEGTANATKSAWENLKSAIGRGEGIKEAFSGLKDAIFGVGLTEDGKETGLLNQVIPRIQTIMSGIGDTIRESAPMVAEKIPALIEAIAPSILNGGMALASALVDGIITNLPSLWKRVKETTSTVGDYIAQGMEIGARATENVDFVTPIAIALDKVDEFINGERTQQFIDNGFTIVSNLATGIGNSAPEVLPKATEVVTKFVDGITDNAPRLLEAGGKMVIGIAEGIATSAIMLYQTLARLKVETQNKIDEAIPDIITKGSDLVTAFCDGVINNIPMLIETGGEMIIGIAEGLILNAPKILIALEATKIKMLAYVVKASFDIKAKVREGILNVILTVGTHLAELAPKIAYHVGYAVTTFALNFKRIVDTTVDTFKKVISAVIDFGKNFKDRAPKLVNDFRDEFLGAMGNLIEKVAEKAKQIGEAFINGIKGVLNGAGHIFDAFWDGAESARQNNQTPSATRGSAKVVGAGYTPRNAIKSTAPYTNNVGMDASGAGFDYDKLAKSVVKAITDSDIKVECDDREFGRLVRKAVIA